MKILYVINSFNRAGAEKLVFNLSRGAVKCGQEVSVAALYRTNSQAESEMCAELNALGINTYILDKKAGANRVRTAIRLAKIARKEKTEIIHAHCSVPMLMGKLAGLLTGTPVVCTVHSTRGYKRIRERLTSRMTKAYVSIGESAEEYMVHELRIKPKKITRIYNAIDMSEYDFQPADKKFWIENGFKEDAPTAINIGRVVPLKNQVCFVKAIKECRDCGSDIQAAILGDYDTKDETYIELSGFIDKNGLGGSIKLLGNKNNIAEYLNNAECFVMTSEFEGLSVAYLEAAACNVPIITTDMPFVHEIETISPGSAIVAQNDYKAIAEAILNRSYGKRSDAAMANLRKMFSLERFVQKHIELYSQIVQ